ncbi:MAG: 4-hydroxybutyrate CoA-transferase [Bacteroidetes bacterium]|jgi:acyl-CoA hydrolase|nr:4-hydroxybutyrate CoA-transferase [Bacteroidota bacterium]
MPKFISLSEAAALVKSDQSLFIHGGAATPHAFIDALAQRKNELRNVKTIHMHLEGNLAIAEEGCEKAFLPNAIFIGADLRKSVNEGHAQYIPVFLSEAPGLFRKNIWPLDFAFVQVSPPDVHGWCSLGVSVDIAKAAVDTAKKVIAIINPGMPRVHGDGLVHVSRFFKMVMNEEPIFEVLNSKPDAEEMAIGKNIASLVEDGATLQMGIGGIPNAALQFLNNFKNLGVHTEMFSDGILPLLESGVINNSKKSKHPGKVVSTFVMGSRKLYDFINDNPSILLLDAAYTNDTHIIRGNPKATAINSAIEIDLSGQVCADSIGTRLYSGVGGQMDFIRGASLSEGGKPIIALKSQTSKGESKISATLKNGAGVVTTRAHVHYIVTEFGIAYLYGKNVAQRAKLLIEIAHPNHRAKLEEEAFKLYGKCW